MRCRLAMLATLMLFAVAHVMCAQQPANAPGAVASPVERQFHEALSSAQRGDQQTALTLTDSILQQHPDFVPALKLQAMLLEQSGHSDEAVAAYRKALKQSPADPDLLYNLGVNDLVSGRLQEAITFLDHYLRLEPRDGDALYYLAQAYHLNGDDQRAFKAIRECLKLEPNRPSFLQKYGELLSSSGDDQQSLEWLRKAQRADPSLERIDYDLAAANFNSMNFDDAHFYAEKAVRGSPDTVAFHALLASIDLKLSMWLDAQVEFERVLANDGDNVAALLGLGQCQLELRDFQSSAGTLQHLLAIDPTQVTAHFYLSRAYKGLGNTDEAKHEADLHQRLLEQASFTRSAQSAVDPKEQAIRAQARRLLADGHEDEAITLLNQNSQGATASPGAAYVAAGMLYLSIGKSQEATRILNRAMELEPKVRGAHTYLGIQAMLQGDLVRAEVEFHAELANDPNYAVAIAELGEVRYRQQRWPEAIKLFHDSQTTIPPMLYMLCDSYFRVGNSAEAKLTAETLAAYDRADTRMMQALADLLSRNQQADLAKRLASSVSH